MSDRSYGAFFQPQNKWSQDKKPDFAPTQLKSIAESGSPSAVWGGIKTHLGLPKSHNVSDLKQRGYLVMEVNDSRPPKEQLLATVERVVPRRVRPEDNMTPIVGIRPLNPAGDDLLTKAKKLDNLRESESPRRHPVDFYDTLDDEPDFQPTRGRYDWRFFLSLASIIAVGGAIYYFTI